VLAFWPCRATRTACDLPTAAQLDDAAEPFRLEGVPTAPRDTQRYTADDARAPLASAHVVRFLLHTLPPSAHRSATTALLATNRRPAWLGSRTLGQVSSYRSGLTWPPMPPCHASSLAVSDPRRRLIIVQRFQLLITHSRPPPTSSSLQPLTGHTPTVSSDGRRARGLAPCIV